MRNVFVEKWRSLVMLVVVTGAGLFALVHWA
jgi:hypothetical protein